MKIDNRPDFISTTICSSCADKVSGYANKKGKSFIASFYKATCCVCREEVICTEVRDYRINDYFTFDELVNYLQEKKLMINKVKLMKKILK